MEKQKQKKLREVFEALQGLNCEEWRRVRDSVDSYFRRKASEQEREIPIGGPEDLLNSYRYHTS